MNNVKDKISLRQVFLIYIVITYTPSIRFVSSYATIKANQVGYLCPIFSFIISLIFAYLMNQIFKKYPTYNFGQIIEVIMGRLTGKLIIFAYFIWLTIVNSLYLRYASERLVTSNFPNINIFVYMFTFVVLIVWVIKSNIIVIARMIEIIFYIITIIFFLVIFITLPNIEIENLTPITRFDIIPIIKGGFGMTGLFYLTYLFFIFDDVKNKKEFLKDGILSNSMIFLILTLLIIVTIGIMGESFLVRTTLPFYSLVRNIKILGNISGFESIIISTWIFADFVITTIFIYIGMKMLKTIFPIIKENFFYNIYIMLVTILSLFLASNLFELQTFSTKLAIYINIFFQFLVPLLIYIIGKFRNLI